MNWKDEIVKLIYIKQILAQFDTYEIFPLSFPNVAASNTEFEKLGSELGKIVDAKYLDFLRYANGWNGFYQSVNLFGTNDLISGERIIGAYELLNSLEESTVNETGLHRNELLPIAVSEVEIDLFCIGKLGSSKPGQIFWFAGSLIETFSDFEEYFLSMMDYNRAQIELLKG